MLVGLCNGGKRSPTFLQDLYFIEVSLRKVDGSNIGIRSVKTQGFSRIINELLQQAYLSSYFFQEVGYLKGWREASLKDRKQNNERNHCPILLEETSRLVFPFP